MKTAVGVFVAALMLSATAFAQDLSSFYAISGFRLPALRSGQYMLSVTPHYAVRPSDYASFTSSTSATSTSSTLTNSGTSYYTPYTSFSASSSFVYGLSDQTTVSLGLSYLPYHSYGTRTILSSSSTDVSPSSAQTNSVTDGSDLFHEQNVASTLTLAHRLQPNIELSLSASWSYSRSPYAIISDGSALHNSGGLTPTLSTTTSSSNGLVSSNGHAFDISATLVVLGY